MTILDFTDELQKELRRLLPAGADIRILGQQGRGSIEIFTPADLIYPSFSLAHCYQDHQNGKSAEAIAAGLLRMYCAETLHPFCSAEDFPDQQSFLDALRLYPCSVQTGKRLIRGMPQLSHLGMVFLYTVRPAAFPVLGDAPVTDELLARLRVRESALLPAALTNLQREEAARVMPLPDYLAMIREDGSAGSHPLRFPAAAEKSDYYVLTNTSAYLGASVLLYPGLDRVLHRRFGDFYLLPSSIHELLILPVDKAGNPQRLKTLIRRANAASADDLLVLSDELYACSAEKGFHLCV